MNLKNSNKDTISIDLAAASPAPRIYTVSTNTASLGANGYSHANWNTQAGAKTTIAASGTIDLKGENADIRVNNVSLMDTLNSIAERLNILRPNPELETEWNKLKELGDQYRALEKEFKEKSKVWEKLTAMPPPMID